jgi:hypothetical protein
MSPAISYAKDLIADGYVGRVLTAFAISQRDRIPLEATGEIWAARSWPSSNTR